MTCRLILVLFICAAAPIAAQTPSGPAAADGLARGWALLAQGDAAQASRLAQTLLAQQPADPAVLALAIQAETIRGGSTAGLDAYELWLGARRTESPYVLRLVGRALLHELASDKTARAARPLAIDALVADGDPAISAEQAQAPGADPADRNAHAAVGDPQAIATLVAELQTPTPNKAMPLASLAKSRSPLAVKPIAALLKDPNPVTRMQAADALGQLGSPLPVADLKALLNDPVFPVKFAAARALFALKDPAGTPLLRQILTNSPPGVRIGAARAMQSEPDAAWLESVRALLKDEDPDVRRQAAELLGAHDPNAAQAVLEPLLNDPNPAEREAASDSYLRYVATDFGTLRKALRNADAATRARAADRILQLTR
jgi:hypothetical protein